MCVCLSLYIYTHRCAPVFICGHMCLYEYGQYTPEYAHIYEHINIYIYIDIYASTRVKMGHKSFLQYLLFD